MQKYSSV